MANYVDNKVFLRLILEYKDARKLAKLADEPMPQISDPLAEIIMLMANRVSQKSSFHLYTFRDDMVGDAIENCVKYLHKFNEKQSSNPFSYFTQTIKNAFLRRIEKEAKQQYIRFKMIDDKMLHDDLYAPGNLGNENTYQNTLKIISKWEKMEKKKRERQQKKRSLKK